MFRWIVTWDWRIPEKNIHHLLTTANLYSFSWLFLLFIHLAYPYTAATWQVLILLLISSSLSPLFRTFGVVPRTRNIIGITVTFMLHIFRFIGMVQFFLSFTFAQRSDWTTKSPHWQVLLFFLSKTRLSFHVRIRWSDCMSKSQRIFGISFSWRDAGLCIWLCQDDQILTTFTVPCGLLKSTRCTCHSCPSVPVGCIPLLCIWLFHLFFSIVGCVIQLLSAFLSLSLSQRYLHLQFSYVFSIVAFK